MNNDGLEYAALVELLANGPVGGCRDWAAWLVLRMLETKGNCRYRGDDCLGGAAQAQTATASLRAAVRVLSAAEQGLLLRAILTLPWEQLCRSTGLSLRLPEILAELVSRANRCSGVNPRKSSINDLLTPAAYAARQAGPASGGVGGFEAFADLLAAPLENRVICSR